MYGQWFECLPTPTFSPPGKVASGGALGRLGCEDRTNGIYVFIKGLEEAVRPLCEDKVCHLAGTILKQRTGFSKQPACGILILGLLLQIYKM